MEVKLNNIEILLQNKQNNISGTQKSEIPLSRLENEIKDMPAKKTENQKEYSHEDAVMDLEAIKRFFYMLAGIEYVPKNEFGYEKRSEIWA